MVKTLNRKDREDIKEKLHVDGQWDVTELSPIITTIYSQFSLITVLLATW